MKGDVWFHPFVAIHPYLKRWPPLISHVQTLVSWKHQVWRMVLLAGIATFRRRWLWKRSHQEKGLQSQSQRWPHWRRVPGIFFLGGVFVHFSATKTGMVSSDVTVRLSHPKVWCGSWLLGLNQLQRYLYVAKGPHCTKLRSVHSSGVATCDVPSTLHSGHGKCSRSSAPCHQVRDAWALCSLHTAHLLCEVPGGRDYRPQVWLWLWSW